MTKTDQDMTTVSLGAVALGDRPVDGAPEADLYAMPATPGQVRFWSLDQLDPGFPALNMPLMWQCTGELNVSAMVEAFNSCVRRHESLRTTFELSKRRLQQILHPPADVPIPIIDLSGWQGEEQKLKA